MSVVPSKRLACRPTSRKNLNDPSLTDPRKETVSSRREGGQQLQRAAMACSPAYSEQEFNMSRVPRSSNRIKLPTHCVRFHSHVSHTPLPLLVSSHSPNFAFQGPSERGIDKGCSGLVQPLSTLWFREAGQKTPLNTEHWP